MTQLPRKRLSNVFLITGSIGVLDFLLLMLLGTGLNFGVLLPVILGTLFILFGLLLRRESSAQFAIHSLFLKRAIMLTLGLLITSFLLVGLLILSAIKPDDQDQVDYLIILGAGLRGEQLSITFQNRLDKGLEYLAAHPEMKAIVSGGQGYGETITEAEAMKRYLMKHGISADRIIKEEKATSTMENFKLSKSLIPQKKNGERLSLMIVTSDFHMYRAKMLGKRNGFIVYGLPSKTRLATLPNNCIREYFAMLKSFVFDR